MPHFDNRTHLIAGSSDLRTQAMQAAIYELRNALTVVRAYAQLIQRRAGQTCDQPNDQTRNRDRDIDVQLYAMLDALATVERAAGNAERSLRIIEHDTDHLR